MKKGYTLIELLVVIGIIGVLVAYLFVSYSRSQAKARDARRKADLGTIGVSLESYFNDHNAYPEAITFGGQFADEGGQIYMKKLPQDPKFPDREYCYTLVDDFHYTLGADYETTMEGVRCTEVGSTPAPTAGPTPSPVPTLPPTSPPAGQCFGGHWFEIGPAGACVPADSIGPGQPVNGGCDAWSCLDQINYCHFQDDNCPLFTNPDSPWYNQGRKYTTCECRLP